MTDEHYKKLPWYFWLTGVEWLLLTVLVVTLSYAGYQAYRLDQVTDELSREKRWTDDLDKALTHNWIEPCKIESCTANCGHK